MILFILIEIAILTWTIFGDDWLIYHVRKDLKYKTNKIKSVFEDVGVWFLANGIFALLNVLAVFTISFFAMCVLCFTQPKMESEWSFNINALKDNLVTEGEFHGSMFGTRGYVDGELSYFYSRTMSKGEIIEHIPADKTYIRYDDTVHPRVEVHQSNLDIPEWLYKVFFLETLNKETTDYYVIVAPEGTITNTGIYQIDME